MPHFLMPKGLWLTAYDEGPYLPTDEEMQAVVDGEEGLDSQEGQQDEGQG